jgi:predicted amidohydrolase
MRILLAATNAAKDDVAGNLRRHQVLLAQGRAQDCQLVAFPEFSLTGSVDPDRHPERAVALDAPPVRELVAATWRAGVAAVFGVAERAGEAFHITQLYAHDGRIGGVYRKRHLGEGEEAYRAGSGGGVFELGAARFGITLCAESGVDFPGPRLPRPGASVVLFCSAPGLYGRCEDEQGWREGHAWWLSAGLGDAARHARRLGLPVAMTTQAGRHRGRGLPRAGRAGGPVGCGRPAARLAAGQPGRRGPRRGRRPPAPGGGPVPGGRRGGPGPAGPLPGRPDRPVLVGRARRWARPGRGPSGRRPAGAAGELGRDGVRVGPWIGRRPTPSGWDGG